MRIAFYASDKPREHLLADAFLMGARAHGHTTFEVSLGDEPEPGAFDVVCLVGVKSRERFHAQHRAGARLIYLDKGYDRHKSRGPQAGWEYWRVAVDAHQPTRHLQVMHKPIDRMLDLGWDIAEWRVTTPDAPIVIAGSSLKYHEFYGLPHPTTYAKEIVRQLRGLTTRPLIYRPKPSWREATPLIKAAFSRPPETLTDLLGVAHAVVTHGSNSCFEAVMAGVPCIVLGDGVAKPISATEITARTIKAPPMAKAEQRLQWAANLAYCQWSVAELSSGEAWNTIREQLHAL